MELINYSVKVPQLDGMTEKQRNRAIEDYMRESNRQLRMIFEQIQKEGKTDGDKT